ncbi:rhodanese-like domain-containing protein [Brevibacillus fortis]|uniref:rhodanese-like domain-containing protein n=1 Tax=Brevibacillus fortis TaxID=2126352 RepID=UPI001FC9D7DA|nr:rhodanese-like domain-containing protein [Brevibacillus fortis]MED1783905.1 rhodanese-like domain-containing protein [Brevibacillus fortis]
MQNHTLTTIQLSETLQQKKPVLLLDVRDTEKFMTGSLVHENAPTRNVPYLLMKELDKPFDEETEKLAQNVQIVTVCTTGNKAQKAAALLREHGFHANALEGGLTAWKEQSNEAK